MSDRHLVELERELALTRANLQDTINELVATNEELQATNEELMASNEELQSTNEDLQSVNEELHSVNAEYEAKIDELDEVYADLDSLTRATQIPLVFLDADLRLTRFTPAATTLFRFVPADIGRPVTDLSHALDDPDLYDVARRTLDALPQHVAVLADDGEVLVANRAWHEFAAGHADHPHHTTAPGANHLDTWRSRAADDPAAARVLAGLTRVIDGELGGDVAQHPVRSPTGPRWFLMHATALDEGGCVVTHTDVTGWIDPARVPPEEGP